MLTQSMIDKGRWWGKGLQLIDGCTPCSLGCNFCWSANLSYRFQRDEFGWPIFTYQYYLAFNGDIKLHPDRLAVPLKRKKPTVWAIWNDLFHEAVPGKFINEAWMAMFNTKHHVFLILTKRPQILKRWTQAASTAKAWPSHEIWPDHVYLGLTICTQQEADEKIPIFLQVPGKKFLSIEPMLENIKIPSVLLTGFKNVILGCETIGSHPGREMKLAWAESIAEQCEAANVPLFVKQLNINGKVSKNEMEWPEKLRKRNIAW